MEVEKDRQRPSLDEMIDGLVFTDPDGQAKNGVPVAFWLPLEYKKKFSELQDKSGRGFSRIAREALMRTIDAGYDRLNAKSS